MSPDGSAIGPVGEASAPGAATGIEGRSDAAWPDPGRASPGVAQCV